MLSKTTKLLSASLRLSKIAQFSKLNGGTCFLTLKSFNKNFGVSKSFFSTNPQFEKDEFSEGEDNIFEAKEIETNNLPNSLTKFNISPITIERLQSLGITSLFPIQAATYNAILEGKDIIARDATGSGKTLSYVLPICEKLRNNDLFDNKYGQTPLALVVLPTRELALQVTNVFNSVKHHENDFRVLTVYGGADARTQIEGARRGAEILVGTPGRLIDLIDRGAIDLSTVKTVVLDEADLMLDMGFQEDIENIYGKLQDKVGKKEVQTMLHSATMPSWVHDVAKKFLRDNLIKVDLLKNKQVKMPSTVTHLAISCPFSKRSSTLADVVLCYGGQHARTIIFTETKKEANDILIEANIRQECQVLHGGIPQEQREVTFRAFREGKFKCLIATNVAARGLDIPEVDLIIQLDPPSEVETYIHRAGRTARAGKSGVCVTFYSSKNIGDLETIERVAKFKFQKVGVPQPQDVIKASSRDIAASVGNVSSDVSALFKEISQELIQGFGAEEALARALALVSGTTEKFKQRSLISSHEGYVTYELNSQADGLSFPQILSMLKDIFPPHLINSFKDIKRTKDRTGAVFDVSEDLAKELDKFTSMNLPKGVSVQKAETLKELEDYQQRTSSSSSRGGSTSRDYDRRSSRDYDRNSSAPSRGYDRRSSAPSRDYDRKSSTSYGNRDPLSFKDNNETEVFVSSLGYNVEEKDLEDVFRQAKLKVRRVRILRDEENRSKGVGFVSFSRKEEVEEALRMTGTDVGGREIRINRPNKR